MKNKLLAIIVGIVAVMVVINAFDDEVNDAYGIWFSKSPEELLEQSETVFVGTVTSVDAANIEHQRNIGREKDGVYEQFTEIIMITLDEYTVHVEEYLKNPQETPTMTVLEATVGGVPTGPARIGGFEIGDRGLFYVPKIDGTNQYSPESFKIPEQCDAKSVLVEPRIQMGNAFTILQDNMPRADNFTAGKPMKFVYGKDMRTLEDKKTFDVHIGISKIIDEKNMETVFQKDIRVESKPCEWISSAEWEFTPQTEGNYRMYLGIKEDGDQTYSTSDTGFSVKSGRI